MILLYILNRLHQLCIEVSGEAIALAIWRIAFQRPLAASQAPLRRSSIRRRRVAIRDTGA